MNIISKLIISVLILAGTASGITIHVPGDAMTIQAGIDSADYGDTILVSAGTYYENITYEGMNVVIISESGPEQTIISGVDSNTVVLFVNQETRSAVLDGFTI